MGYRLGIDLGGTKTEIVALDPDLRTLFRERVATPARNYADILAMLEALVARAESSLGASASIGIGVPGALSPKTGMLRNSNTVCLNGKPFRRDLEARLGRRVRLENDANCFALWEAVAGAGRDYPVVFGVIIGTGTGGGLVVDGKLVNGLHAISGEWGHNPLPWRQRDDADPGCYCGKTGCIETFLSGPGLERNFAARFGRSLGSAEIVAGAADGDGDCRTMMDAYHGQMARALAHLINIVDPHAIVLGGGMSNIESIYASVPRLLPSFVFSDFVATPLLPAAYGDSSGVYGAALLRDADAGAGLAPD